MSVSGSRAQENNLQCHQVAVEKLHKILPLPNGNRCADRRAKAAEEHSCKEGRLESEQKEGADRADRQILIIS